MNPYDVLIADKSKSFRHPDRQDSRYSDGMLFPRITPKFQIHPGETVFAIGSCFARNIEEKLRNPGVRVACSRAVDDRAKALEDSAAASEPSERSAAAGS